MIELLGGLTMTEDAYRDALRCDKCRHDNYADPEGERLCVLGRCVELYCLGCGYSNSGWGPVGCRWWSHLPAQGHSRSPRDSADASPFPARYPTTAARLVSYCPSHSIAVGLEVNLGISCRTAGPEFRAFRTYQLLTLGAPSHHDLTTHLLRQRP